ncbi:DUF4145 domain-containing protein [Devosia sp. SL43]|uniref:DUF4145 domain-containing protein n=1 Tax=Devosia sp. SL43 TaxID=2806348 RepID=UPI001F1E57F7|nr:DUF4145 domain-containing protein [Devosia sp. SL43]UJW85584.1 DUF4145 domain-containing protein [Devosia sp. SL43]
MTKVSETKPIKGHCPTCGDEKWADTVGHYNEYSSDIRDGIWVSIDHRILKCRGCDAIYHQTDRVFSEDMFYSQNPETGEEEYDYEHDVKHWPAPNKRPRPNWLERLPAVDTDLYKLLNDVYSALDIDLAVLAAIGVRTTFDRGSELLGIDSSLTFSEKLTQLVDKGFAGATERDALSVMTEAGNASAHRGWRPSSDQLDTMLQIIEAFVHRNFVLRTDVTELKNAVPAKPPRKPKNPST